MPEHPDERLHTPFAYTVSRRTLLRGGVLGGVGLAAAALIGCGGDDDDDDDTAATTTTTTTTTSGTGTTTQAATSDDDEDEGGAQVQVTEEDVEDEDTVATIKRAEGFTTEAGRFVPFQIPEPDTPPKFGGTMTQRFTFDPGPLDPAIAAAGGTMTAVNMMYNRVIGVYSGWDSDPYSRNDLVPELAESWEISEDGLTYTFNLRGDVKFHNIPPINGRNLVASDVKFSWDRYKDVGSPHRSYFLQVASIDVVDDQTVAVTLNQPTPDFIYPISTAYTTVHGPELVDSGEITSTAIGTGPMILDHWTGGVGGGFNKNPDYFRGPVKIDRWELPLVRDAAAGWAQFRVGNHDFGMSAATSDELEAILDTNPDTQYFSAPIFASTFALNFNMDLPKWQDERLRRGISLAYDREEILDVIYSGAGIVLPQMDWRFFWEDEPSAENGTLGNWWRHDADEAQKLLAAAGEDELEFDLVYYNYSNTSNSLQNEVLIDQFRRVGMKLNANAVDYTEYNSQWTTRSGESESFDGWASFSPTADHYVFGLNHSGSGGNRNRINDPEIDAWAEQHQVELDPETRTELARNVWNKVLDQVYRIEKPSGYAAYLQQPWLRAVRYIRPIGSGHFYLDTGYEAFNAWIDK